jgi:hypothetical protein
MGEDQKQPFQLSFNRFLRVAFQMLHLGHHPSGGGAETRVGFIVTNLTLPSRAVVRFYNKRAPPNSGLRKASRR